MGLTLGIGLDKPPAPAGDSPLLVDLLAFYNLNGNLTDSSGNARTLTGAGDTYGAGLIGQALVEGTGEDATWISGVNWHDTPWSVSAWFKVATISDGNGAGKVVLIIGVDTIVTVQVLGTGSNTAEFQVTTGGDVDAFGALNQGWHHVAVTYSAQSLEPQVYVDGAAAGAMPSDGVTSSTSDVSFVCSADADAITPVDLVGVWQRQLSADEVAELYNGGAGFDPTA